VSSFARCNKNMMMIMMMMIMNGGVLPAFPPFALEHGSV
jgi:hypothetical protein